MKRFFEKYDLIKLAGIMIIIATMLTWFIPLGRFSGTEIVADEVSRIGLNAFLENGLYGPYYFTMLLTFLLVLGGFYQVLSKRAGYQRLIKKISEKLKGCEIPVVLVVSLLFAIIGSLSFELFPAMTLMPFIITILNRMKVDKISAFVATFGGLLVGVFGSTFSVKVANNLMSTFGVETADVLTTQTILFVLAFILLSAFTILRLRKQKDDKEFQEYDLFKLETTEENSKKAPKIWPYVIGIILFTLVTILAYLPWQIWEISLFDDITKWVNEFSIGKVPIISYIFGEFKAFGDHAQDGFTVFKIQHIMVFATLLIHWFGRMSLSDIFDCYGEGFKKLGKVTVVMLAVYTIVIFSFSFPVMTTIVGWIDGFTEGFNAILAYIGAFITSLFSVEMQYTTAMAGTFYSTVYTEVHNTLLIIFQTAFGLVSFFAPSSVILMMGLAYLDIPYKEWMKFIWKFLLVLLVISIAIILIIA